VVDDEEQIRRILAEFLTKTGFEVIQASGGEEAIRLLKSDEKIDIFVVDMKMPKVTGRDVLKEKKMLNDVRPVIILTGSITLEKDIGALKELGVEPDDILTKPIDLFLFLEAVKKKLHMGD
jgi:DNA-binding response OmpR family regulator